MRLFRRITFTLFCLAYLIICPLTILHAFGYSFGPNVQQPLVKTGLIYLSTTPSGASVYLGKRRFTQRTPATLSGLLPGEYNVRVVMKDFRPWERVLPVAAEKATALENILLLPARLLPQQKYREAISSLVEIPGTHYLLLMTGPLLRDISIYDWKEDKAWPLLEEQSSWRPAEVIEVNVVPDSQQVLFHVEQAGQSYWLSAFVRRGEMAVEDLTKMLVDAPELFFWNTPLHRYLFAFQKTWINRVDFAGHAVSPKWADGVKGFGLSGRSFYALHSDGQLVRLDRDGKEEEQIARLELPKPPALGRPSWFRIHMAGPNSFFLTGSRGELLSTRAPYQLVESGVLGCDWVLHRQKALFWTKQQIGLLKVSDEMFEFEKNEEPVKLHWIDYAGEAIQQVQWVDEGAHLLIRDNSQLFLADLQSYGPPQIELLAQSASPFVYVEELGRIYYLEPETRHLVSLQLLSKKEILPLPALEYRSLHEPEADKQR